jgi:hypothetical protein
MRPKRVVCIVAILFLLGSTSSGGQQDLSQTVDFGSSYANLVPQQKRLIDDWFQRFSAAIKKHVDPAEGYNVIPLSSKTTFNAVTHALLRTKLTDASGEALADSSLDLVNKIDSVAGEILGEKSDHQFRIYVQMKPGAAELLKQSSEFARKADNTVFHKGYPICFRSNSGTPSIQISLSSDESRADIDVDYRSSRFPAALVNGHLTAGNSDVRAGNNDERHNQQWSGLQNWWRNVLGWPIFGNARAVSADGRVIPQEPRVKNDKPADAIYDFLSSWLVEQKPDYALAYISDSSLSCGELETGSKVDFGVERYAIFREMMEVNERIGQPSSLSEVTVGVLLGNPKNEQLKVIQQPHHGQFVLYDVREDLAEQFKCGNRLDASQRSEKAMRSKAFGRYAGAMFRLKSKEETGHVVATLWQKGGGYWRLVSYDVDPEIGESRVPNVGTPVASAAPLQYVAGDKEMVKAASDFLTQWLLKKDIGKAASYIAPECLACVKLYADEDSKAPSTDEEARILLVAGLARAADATHNAKALEDVMVAAQPHHEDVRLVKHKDAKAFVVVAVPDSIGDATNCERRGPDGEPVFSGPATSYGKYYVTGMSLKTNAAVFWVVWRKVNDEWKIVSYVVINP